MRYFSAQFVFTNSGPPLRRPVICTEEDGTIVSIADTSGELPQKHSLEFYNGIIVPGFVNCHCHLELSWMKGKIPEGTGLAGFLASLNSIRNSYTLDPVKPAEAFDHIMANEGVVICADICNTDITFDIKKKSRIKYINLLEVFGIDSLKAQKRIDEIMELAFKAEKNNLKWQIVPHSAYSVSKPLFRLIREKAHTNSISSVHILESEEEYSFLSRNSGPLSEAYRNILSPSSVISMVSDHKAAILDEITQSGNLLLVHNTFINRDIIESLKKRKGIFYCLCPNSNRYIGGNRPPVRLLAGENCTIVVGTDSLSSNTGLSIISELYTIQDDFPEFKLEELIKWATINGAQALGQNDLAGSIEPGKKPGLVLIENLDLKSMRLLPESNSRRLI